jgi:tRNA(Arg) A34 adenosine deaminase TadA
MRHAQLNILCEAFARFNTDVFPQCIFYSNNEPCPIHAGAIYWSGVRQVVYSLSASGLIEIRGWGLKWRI